MIIGVSKLSGEALQIADEICFQKSLYS